MSVVLPCIWFFILGCTMGSFFNVLADRLPEGRDVVFARSSCTECKTALKWYDLIPVVSFVSVRGKCRYCGAKLSPWYFVSELLVGALYALAFLLYARTGDAAALVWDTVLWSLLFIVAAMDAKTSLIMDIFPALIAVCGIAYSLICGRRVSETVLGGAVGFAVFGTLYLGARLILRREGLGFGDVLLLCAVGFFMPWLQVIITAFLSAYVALVFLLVRALCGRRLGMKTEFPLGPSVCTAAFIMSIFGDAVAGFITRIITG